MNFLIQIPSSFYNERSYIIDVLFRDILGLDFNINIHEKRNVIISASDSREIILEDVFFSMPEEYWLKTTSLPKTPLCKWNVNSVFSNRPFKFKELPIIYGKEINKSEFIIIKNNKIRLGIDILGSAFFMLSRYEEIVKRAPFNKDIHDRFPAVNSLAFKEGFISRPIVNEYLEVLWGCLEILWPGILRKKRYFRIISTHDIDNPFELLLTFYREYLYKKIFPHLIKGRINTSAKNLFLFYKTKRGLIHDKFDTCDWLMDQSEKNGEKCAFFIKANQIETKQDKLYDLSHPAIKEMVKKIFNRGHEIGFHPGFHTYKDKRKWFEELKFLRKSFPDIEIKGGRQHFLKFEIPETWRYWDEAGMEYDSTLGFADHSGFRCGICYEFPVYDIIHKRKMNVRERPLIIMDKTLTRDKYMGLNAAKSFELIENLKGEVKHYDGDFVTLWHNNNLRSNESRELFTYLINKNNIKLM